MREAGLKTRSLLGLEVAVARRKEALSLIYERFCSHQKTLVVFANTNFLSLSRKLCLSAEVSNECIVLNDGIGLDIISLILAGVRFPDNLNGTDFTLDILRSIAGDAQIFCFGSKESVVNAAAAELVRSHSLRVAGTAHGYTSKSFMESELICTINASRSDVILVGLGNTRQEEWMLVNAHRLSARLIVCVGAFFDFTAGSVYRAPVWARRLRVEWLIRLYQEPSRLWRRYTVDPVMLAVAAIWERLRAIRLFIL